MAKPIALIFLVFAMACEQSATSKVVQFYGKIISAKDSTPISNMSVQLAEGQSSLLSGNYDLYDGLSDSMGCFSCKVTLILDRSHNFHFAAVGWLSTTQTIFNDKLKDDMHIIQTMWPDTFVRND